MDVYVSQLNPGGTHDTFYTDATIIAAYEKYISEFVGRYVDEPTILAWELANEPRCRGSTGFADLGTRFASGELTVAIQNELWYMHDHDGYELDFGNVCVHQVDR